MAVMEEHAEGLCVTGAAEGWSAEPCCTHHGAHHPANVNGVIAMRAVQVLIPQEFGVDVQHLEADGQDLIFKLVQERERGENTGEACSLRVETAQWQHHFVPFVLP